MAQSIKIAVLNGSVRMGRKSPAVAEYLVKQLEKEENFDITYLDLREYNLPIMHERRGIHPNLPPMAEKLGTQLEEADAILVVTPEYNGGYPGVLKNALDYYYDEISKKPVGVVSVSSGQQGGIQAWQALTGLFLKVGSFVAPARLHVAQVAEVFNDEGNVVSDYFTKSTDLYLKNLLWFIEALVEKKRKS